MKKPYVICHMTTSIDGKVTGEFLQSPDSAPAIEMYYQINRDFRADAYACGRITMEESFTGNWKPDLSPYQNISVPREDFIADTETKFYAAAFDRRGQLGWKSAKIEDEDPGYNGAHIIEILCENVSDAYLSYLQTIGISYLFAGKEDLDLRLVLEKLNSYFGIKTLLLEGGSILNSAFLKEDLIDELSLITAPVLADTNDKPLFAESIRKKFKLIRATVLGLGTVWLQYKK